MSDKFLGNGGSYSANLTNGTVPFYGLSIGAQSLDPSQPVKTNSLRQLVSEKLDIADVYNLESRLDEVLTNPFVGTLQATDFETSNYFSVNDELKKIDNITSATQAPDITNMTGILKVPELAIDRLYNTSQSIYIDLTTTDVDINATNLKFNGDNLITTPYVGEIEATSFKKTGGTSIQYLMANGSTLTQSANSGNSNFYLYNSGTSQSTTPANGYITYNNATQSSATVLYISHLTRDNFDIEVFFYQITTLTDVYVQDQNNSALYIQYNITATPTITANARITIPVLVSSQGTTGFADGHNVFISFFTNSLEVDTRISAVESDVINQTAVSGTSTTFSGAGGVIANKFVKSGSTSSDVLLGDGSTTTLSNVGGGSSSGGLSYEQVPRGARDTWETTNGITIAGSGLKYLSTQNLLYSFNGYQKLSYSTNGGISWADATGLSSTVLYGNPAYNSSTGQYLVLGGNLLTSVCYTSTNGTSWTLASSPTTLNSGNSYLINFGGYFIVNTNTVGNNVAVSTNGVSWATQPCVNTIYDFRVGLDDAGTTILVTSGGGMSYSYDGLTWVAGTGGLSNSRAFCYSSTKKEWIAYSNATLQFYRSLNGKAWSVIGSATSYGTLNDMIWVGDDVNAISINQYYFVINDSNANFSLVYTPSCKDGTFRNIRMKGASAGGGLFYSVLYLTEYDRFCTAINSTPNMFKYANKTNNSAFNAGLTLNGSLTLNGLSFMDVASIERPFIGIQYRHGSGDLTNLSNSLWSALGSTSSTFPTYALTNNFTRQLCCGFWSFPTPGDGQVCGYASTASTGVQVSTGYNWGLYAALGVADTGAQINTCQNFWGLWNAATVIPLNQATQISVQRNMIGFASNSVDANICIYTAGASSTIKQVDLGVNFPSNRVSGVAPSNFYRLSMYWDGVIVYYKAVNTTLNITVQGSFTPLSADMPSSSISMYPQCIRVMGSPQSTTNGRLQVQRFGIFY